MIYNRWGDLVYEENNKLPSEYVGWDGYFRNRKLNPAVFVYKVTVKTIYDELITLTGDVTLIY